MPTTAASTGRRRPLTSVSNGGRPTARTAKPSKPIRRRASGVENGSTTSGTSSRTTSARSARREGSRLPSSMGPSLRSSGSPEIQPVERSKNNHNHVSFTPPSEPIRMTSSVPGYENDSSASRTTNRTTNRASSRTSSRTSTRGARREGLNLPSSLGPALRSSGSPETRQHVSFKSPPPSSSLSLYQASPMAFSPIASPCHPPSPSGSDLLSPHRSPPQPASRAAMILSSEPIGVDAAHQLKTHIPATRSRPYENSDILAQMKTPMSRPTTLEITSGLAPNTSPLTVASPKDAAVDQTPPDPKASHSHPSRVLPKQEETQLAEKRAEQQCEAFVGWINFIINPVQIDDEHNQPSTGMRSVLVERRMARTRLDARILYRSDSMQRVQKVVINEIKVGKMAIRQDCDLTVNMVLRKQVLRLLFSYEVPWLRLGLETMYGVTIDPLRELREPTGPVDGPAANRPKRQVSRMRLALEEFLIKHFLADPNILARYSKRGCKALSGNFGARYKREMRAVVLHRLLTLVFFLDSAKQANIIQTVPRLFTKSSDVKSSKMVLQALCKELLSSEGDFVKHLRRIGLIVGYEQLDIDEVDFHVTNLAVDIRDGVILTRLYEILNDCPAKSFLKNLRLPAGNRTRKLFNVNYALTEFNRVVPIPQPIEPYHIVDGHRSKTLGLLWTLIAGCSLSRILEPDRIKQEIQSVIQFHSARSKLENNSRNPVRIPGIAYSGENIRTLVLNWCAAVCGGYDVDVSNFVDSFADGKAICLIIHHYHPADLRADEILPTSRDNVAGEKATANERANFALASKRASEIGGIPDMIPICDASDRPDDQVMVACVSYLCSRLMESSEEIFASILIQKCVRKFQRRILLERKISAAKKIWRVWSVRKDDYYDAQWAKYYEPVAKIECFVKKHQESLRRMRANRVYRMKRTSAATTIQKIFRGSIEREQFRELVRISQSVLSIQQVWRGHQSRKDTKIQMAVRSAGVIQRMWRGHRVREQLLMENWMAMQIQKIFRGSHTRAFVARRNRAAESIQVAWLTFLLKRIENQGAVKIQAAFRGMCAHREYLWYKAAGTIQSAFRRYQVRRAFDSAVVIQRVSRGFQARSMILRQHQAAVTIQAAGRRWIGYVSYLMYKLDKWERNQAIRTIQRFARESLRIMRTREHAARTIQFAFIGWWIRRNAEAAARIQAWSRGVLERREFERALFGAIRIQKFWRVCLLYQRIDNFAATLIQSVWRQFVDRRAYEVAVLERADAASTIIQSRVRGMIARQYLDFFHASAVCIQRQWRGFSSRLYLEYEHCNAEEIQKLWRGAIARVSFEAVIVGRAVKSATRIQASVRRMIQRRSFQRVCDASLCIQRTWRGYSSRTRVHVVTNRVVARMMQSLWRGAIARKAYRVMIDARAQTSAIRIQSSVRGMLRRNALEMQQFCAKNMQKIWRGYSARRDLCNFRKKAATIQAAWRGSQARKLYGESAEKAVTIQRLVRGWLAAASWERQKRAAVLIQSHARGLLSSRDLQRQKRASVVLQSYFRSRQAVRVWDRQKNAAVSIQSFSRRWAGARSLKVAKQAAARIQAFIRGQSAVQSWRLKRNSIIIIQRHARAIVPSRELHNKKKAAVIIQSHVRGMLTVLNWNRQRKAVVGIQSYVRSRIGARSWKQQKKAAVSIQSFVRGRLESHKFQKQSHAVVTIQALFRRLLDAHASRARKNAIVYIQTFARTGLARCHARNRRNAASVLINFARGRAGRISYLRDRGIIIRLQALRRQVVARQFFEKLLLLRKIQSCVRGYMVRKRVKQAHSNAKTIQRCFRGFSDKTSYKRSISCSIIIQSFVRRVSVLRLMEVWNTSAVRIQSSARIWMARRILSVKKEQRRMQSTQMRSSLVIQSTWRGFSARVSFRRNIAAKNIQKIWRGYDTQANYILLLNEIATIQINVRAFLARKRYADALRGSVVLQTFFRRFAAQTQFNMAVRSATKIQSATRAWITRNRYEDTIWATVSIQRFWRRKLIQRENDRRHRAAILIQSQWRVVPAVLNYFRAVRSISKIQSVFRMALGARRAWAVGAERRAVRGLVKLQSLFRGTNARRKFSRRHPSTFRKVVVVNERAVQNPRMRLGNRTKNALRTFRRCKLMTEVMRAALTLETVSRLSIVCCEVMAEVGALDGLLTVIDSCNRSLPQNELAVTILKTMKNLFRHHSLRPRLSTPFFVEVILKVIQTRRDHEKILSSATFLLECAMNSNVQLMIESSSKENLRRLDGMHAAVSKNKRDRVSAARLSRIIHSLNDFSPRPTSPRTSGNFTFE